MINLGSRLVQEWLLGSDPETAHRLSINALRLGLGALVRQRSDPRLALRVCGLDFPNPVGLAAGYDKNGQVPDAMLQIGFGFVEIGSVTPRPQAGNPRPRIFRLRTDRAVINRLGFNNDGHAIVRDRLERRPGHGGIVGVNIGANKDSDDRMADYEEGVSRFADLASYLTVNVSSPNTPNLRALQGRSELDALLARVLGARESAVAGNGRSVPVFLKIAPDLTEPEMDDIAQVVADRKPDGLIVSNTTVSRHGLSDNDVSAEIGGLSGRPLFEPATIALAKMRSRCGPQIAMIGTGGIDSADRVLEKIRAGADLVQLYTGLIYGGPLLLQEILADLTRFVDQTGISTLRDIRDEKFQEWAARPLDHVSGHP